jgi:uncharacterized protein (TIGR00661 family)
VRPDTAPPLGPAADRRGGAAAATAFNSALHLPAYVASGARLAAALRAARVDLVVNFFDLVGALSRAVLASGIPSVALAHNYLFLHPTSAGAPGSWSARRAFHLLSRASMLGAEVRVALSYGPAPDDPALRLRVAPPLLRASLRDTDPTPGSHLLAYAVNPGYANDLAEWHAGRGAPIEVHCFVEGGERALSTRPRTGFHTHDLDAVRFRERLIGCAGYVGSAGFEALCEAFYLGKPALAVPTEGHHEQGLNAWDAARHGAARAGTWADLDAFLERPPVPDPESVRAFRAWVGEAPRHHVAAVEEAAYNPRNPRKDFVSPGGRS